MNYREIIEDNCNNHCEVRWWPQFAFHYTDVKNAASILSCGHLYSRTIAKKLGIMKNDNASRQIIDMTKTNATANVRFYFRPLTPTQYHNEGYKHPDLRFKKDKYANVPVPIFFLFNLEKLLGMPGVQFSELGQAGYGTRLYNSVSDFKLFHFDYIYKNGRSDQWKYKHAEILYPRRFNIDTCLHSILCRNDVDRMTLLNILKRKNPDAYEKYKPFIKKGNEDLFYCNGLYIEKCDFHDGEIIFTLSDSHAKEAYFNRYKCELNLDELRPVNVRLELAWLSNDNKIVYQAATKTDIDYLRSRFLTFSRIPFIEDADKIRIKLYFEDDLMCVSEQSLYEIELIK